MIYDCVKVPATCFMFTHCMLTRRRCLVNRSTRQANLWTKGGRSLLVLLCTCIHYIIYIKTSKSLSTFEHFWASFLSTVASAAAASTRTRSHADFLSLQQHKQSYYDQHSYCAQVTLHMLEKGSPLMLWKAWLNLGGPGCALLPLSTWHTAGASAFVLSRNDSI